MEINGWCGEVFLHSYWTTITITEMFKMKVKNYISVHNIYLVTPHDQSGITIIIIPSLLLSKVISDSGEVPVSLEAVTDTRKGKQILGEGSKVTIRQRVPLVLYVADRLLVTDVSSVTCTS